MAITTSTAAHTSIASVTLEVADPEAARRFYTAFGVDTRIRLRASEAHSTGFRGFTLALTVSRPATVDSFVHAAMEAGATVLKPAAKSLWGYGGVVQAPDGTIWKVATSAKKDTGPATREIDEIVLLLGVEDMKASKQFYVGRGLTVARSFGGNSRPDPPHPSTRGTLPCSPRSRPPTTPPRPQSSTTDSPPRSGRR
ncbi:glyoxalase [Streptomyces shenzhenensis]